MDRIIMVEYDKQATKICLSDLSMLERKNEEEFVTCVEGLVMWAVCMGRK
jgi:hypothetical protein